VMAAPLSWRSASNVARKSIASSPTLSAAAWTTRPASRPAVVARSAPKLAVRQGFHPRRDRWWITDVEITATRTSRSSSSSSRISKNK
jgi:hypothetical protein